MLRFAAALLSLVACGIAGCAARTSDAGLARRTSVEVVVDPRIELLMTVACLAGYEERGLANTFDTPYRRALESHFERWRDHAAVQRFSRIMHGQFAFDAPPSVMVLLGPPPDLVVEHDIPAVLDARAGGAEELDAWLSEMRDFARQSHFMEFFAGQSGNLVAMIAPVEDALEQIDYVASLEEWFGWRAGRFTVVLSLLGRGNFGPRVDESGRDHVFNIMSPENVDDGRLRFREGRAFSRLVWHEFAHSFVNPVVERNRTASSDVEALFAKLAEPMAKLGYTDGQTVLIEHLVRAVTVRLVNATLGSEAAHALRAEEIERGFAYLDPFLHALETYERERATYATFEDFYPQVLLSLASD